MSCRESKRKTAAVVAFRNDERMFSDPALSTVSGVINYANYIIIIIMNLAYLAVLAVLI